jgi:glucokinase
MSVHIAIDIGGTQMRAASYLTNSLEPLKISKIESHIEGVRPQDRLIEVVESIWPEVETVVAIGVAVAGPLDLVAGVIKKSPNIPDFDNFAIVDFLNAIFDVPVFLGNDANIAALGEWKYGSGIGHNDLIYFTISTGIGSGVISDGKMLLGAKGMAAELGHVTIYPGGPVCSCGQRGHLEAIASGTSIAKWVKQKIKKGQISVLAGIKKISAKKVAKAASQGDVLCQQAFERAGTALGIAIVNFLHTFNPTLIILGGGVSKRIDLLLPHINTALAEQVFAPGYLDDFQIKTATLGDDAGLLGALALAREAQPA